MRVVMQQNNQDAPHSEQPEVAHKRPLLVMMIAGSIVIALLLVVTSMWLYNMSGAAQLDLSRPGYQNVRAQAQQMERFEGFRATGELDEEALDAFSKLYRQQQKEIKKDSSGFSSEPLSNSSLGIEVE